MIRKQKGSLEWLEFELFSSHPELIAAVFLRHPDDLSKNHATIETAFGLEKLRICRQPHRDQIAFVPTATVDLLEECDGMMTHRTNEPLLIRHADCQAAIFYDPKNKAIACVHAGWRGQVKNIYQTTVEQMKAVFGSNPSEILVGVSPSLGPDHSEFINYKTEWPQSYWTFQTRPTYFDLWAIGKYQLAQAGILPEHMQFAEICTHNNSKDCYSYRRDKPTGGEHATIASLNLFL